MGLLEEWRTEAFGAIALADPDQENSLWGDLADPDGDGVKNIEEAYFNTLPGTRNLPRQPAPVATPSALRLSWKRPPNFHGVRAIPQWSPNLKDWYVDGEGPPGETRNISVLNRGVAVASGEELMEAMVPRGSDPSIFLRIEYRR